MVLARIKNTLLRDRALALLVLVAMALHTYFKFRWGTMSELLWGCNVASLVIILGLWFRAPHLVGAGFLWHICVGEPAYIYGVVQTGHTHWVSVVVHSLPTVAAFFSLRRTGLPKSAPYLAFLMFVALVPISHYLLRPRLNINLCHHGVRFLEHHVPVMWVRRAPFSAHVLALLIAGDALFSMALKRPARV